MEYKHIHYVYILRFISDCQNAPTMAVVAAAIVDVCWPQNEYRCIWAMPILPLSILFEYVPGQEQKRA